jgi:adenylylsulfate kinase
MAKRILIMGLPGSGKTTLAVELMRLLAPNAVHLNADTIRKVNNDWDFTPAGRLRQSKRMRTLADGVIRDYAIADFVAPIDEMRRIYHADYTVWVDTIREGRFEDTNRVFTPPTDYNIRVTTQNAEHWAKIIADELRNTST